MGFGFGGFFFYNGVVSEMKVVPFFMEKLASTPHCTSLGDKVNICQVLWYPNTATRKNLTSLSTKNQKNPNKSAKGLSNTVLLSRQKFQVLEIY